MKKLIITLTVLSLTNVLYAETTTQSINIYSDAVPQDMSQTQYQAIMSQKPIESSAKQIALTTQREFRNRVYRAWQPPVGSKGESAKASVILSEAGTVISIVVQAMNPEVKTSVEQAIRAAAPFPMPNDPEARQFARTFKVSFTVK